MKHEYTDTQLQAAIDGACLETHREHRERVGSNLVIDTDAMPSVYAAEASARLDLIKSALAALPEPLTVDGKTPGQFIKDLAEEVGNRQAALLAACTSVDELKGKADRWFNQAKSENEKYLKAVEQIAHLQQTQLSQLRPLAEAGPVPEGCVRVTGYKSQHSKTGWVVTDFTYHGDTHFADIKLPAAKADDSVKPDPYAELKAEQNVAGTCTECWGPVFHRTGKPGEFDHVCLQKPEPETFEAHGKTWTRHTPGDPMPCDGGALVELIEEKEVTGDYAKYVDRADTFYWPPVVGWRYADEPTPTQEPMSTKPISLPPTEGMSLRDWFAGMALQGKATRLNNPHEHRDILSSDCYDVADAMLKAREVKP